MKIILKLLGVLCFIMSIEAYSCENEECCQEHESLIEFFAEHLDLKASVDLTNDYRFRGISQTDRGPAIQGEFALESKWGFYTKIWGSNVNLADVKDKIATLEMNYIVGCERMIKDISVDFSFVRYSYPKNTGINYNEFLFSIGYKIITFGLAYSNKVFDTKDRGLYLYADFETSVPGSDCWPFVFKDLTFSAHGGHYNFSGSLSKKDYFDFGIYIKKDLSDHFSIKLGGVFTNRKFTDDKLDAPGFIVYLNASI